MKIFRPATWAPDPLLASAFMALFKFRKGGDEPLASAPQPESIEAVRRRARHRLIGAVVLVLVAVVGFPLLFDTQPRPISEDIPIEIPDRNKARPLPITAVPAVQAPVVTGQVTPAPAPAPAAVETAASKPEPKPEPKPAKVPKLKKSEQAKINADKAALNEEERRWNEFHEKHKTDKAQTYDMKATFAAAQPLQHKILGWGWILSNDNDRLEVLFRDGKRILISNYNR